MCLAGGLEAAQRAPAAPSSAPLPATRTRQRRIPLCSDSVYAKGASLTLRRVYESFSVRQRLAARQTTANGRASEGQHCGYHHAGNIISTHPPPFPLLEKRTAGAARSTSAILCISALDFSSPSLPCPAPLPRSTQSATTQLLPWLARTKLSLCVP